MSPVSDLNRRLWSIPIEKRRKPGLGTYTGTRKEWESAWRCARIHKREGHTHDPRDSGLKWKARLIVHYERTDVCDPLAVDVRARIWALQCVEGILDRERASLTP